MTQTPEEAGNAADPNDRPAERVRRWQRMVLALLLALHLGLGLHTALCKTVTHDEIWHLPVGLRNLQTGTFDADVLNPPLARVWAALPVRLAGVTASDGVDETAIALRFIEEHNDFLTWYRWGRGFNLLFSAATFCLLVNWCRQRLGTSAALLAGVLYVTCPNILAHASLVTPDAGTMLAFTICFVLTDRFLSRPALWTAVVVGAALGAAQGTKFTSVVLLPLFVLACGIAVGIRASGRGRLAGLALISLVISLVVWNATYLFDQSFQPLSRFEFRSSALQSLQSFFADWKRLPVPLPADYLRGVDKQRFVMEQPHPIYLNGVWSVQGFPDYFVRTMQYKFPLPLLFLLAVGTWKLFYPRGRRWFLVALLGPACVLIGFASFSSLQLGVRYVLPILPLLIAVASAAAPTVSNWPRPLRHSVTVVLVAACLSSLRFHPHHLAYFNEIAGGPVGGREHLLDSNLDWGQDLHLVADAMQRHDLNEIGLVYFGTMPAERLGIRYFISPGRQPAPGWHAVSVNYVMGRPHLLREPDGRSRPADINEFAYFQRFAPVERLGYSIDLYFIPDDRKRIH